MSASHRPGLGSLEGFPGLVWRKRGLPRPALYPQQPARLAARMRRRAGPPLGREPVTSGAFPAGADRTRGLPGPAWRPSPGDSCGSCIGPRATLGDPGCAAASGAIRQALVALRSRVAGSEQDGRGGVLVEAPGALHGRGAPRVSPLRPSKGSSLKSPKLLGIFVNYAEALTAQAAPTRLVEPAGSTLVGVVWWPPRGLPWGVNIFCKLQSELIIKLRRLKLHLQIPSKSLRRPLATLDS